LSRNHDYLTRRMNNKGADESAPLLTIDLMKKNS
jgi:hypothetical protein